MGAGTHESNPTCGERALAQSRRGLPHTWGRSICTCEERMLAHIGEKTLQMQVKT